jgi:hypothetical protein
MRPYPLEFSIRLSAHGSTLPGVCLEIFFVFILRLRIYFRFRPRQVVLPAASREIKRISHWISRPPMPPRRNGTKTVLAM